MQAPVSTKESLADTQLLFEPDLYLCLASIQIYTIHTYQGLLQLFHYSANCNIGRLYLGLVMYTIPCKSAKDLKIYTY